MLEPTSIPEAVRRQLDLARNSATCDEIPIKDRVALRLLAEGVEELLSALEDNARERDADRVSAAMLQLVAMGVRLPPETLRILARRGG